MIGMGRLPAEKRLAAVVGAVKLDVHRVHRVATLRVGLDSREVKRALADTAIGIYELPCSACVVRLKQASVVGLDQRVDAIGVGPGGGDRNFSQSAARQSGISGDFGPVTAAVGGFEKPAGGTAARKRPWSPVYVPDGRIKHPRMIWIHREIHRSGPIIAKQNTLPSRASVRGSKYSPFFVWAVGVAKSRDVHKI